MTKDEVYSILKNAQGYVSGEKISSQLGVTRAAVNAAVKTLRKEGYEIASTTNRGYLLVSSPDRLTVGDVMHADSADPSDDGLNEPACCGTRYEWSAGRSDSCCQ